MADDSDDQPHSTLPAFLPVPRQTRKLTGWTPEVQRAFIEALAETGSVRAACRRVGRADRGAYALRRHAQADEFRAAWDAALDIGIRRLEDALTDRAIHGVEVPVFSFGKLIGQRTIYNDRLGMFMLRNRAPHRFATGGGARALTAIDKVMLKRLKQQWRREWEDERRAREPDIEDVRAEILRKVEVIEQARFQRETPRERELRELYRAEVAAREAREEQERRERFAPESTQPSLPSPAEPTDAGDTADPLAGKWD